jgi:predicted small secreted protein
MRKLMLAFASLSVVVALNAGCHTVQGAGEDIKTLGEKTQKAIDPEGQK